MSKKQKGLKDRQGRDIRYMRISVTDRCNFRCRYCTPQSQFEHINHEKVLRYEDILFIAEALAELGVERIRITGGEPLVRKGLPGFLAKLTAIKGINEVTITTNASLIPKYGNEIYEAGVRRLNISLDSLRADRFEMITGGADFSKTMNGIKYAQELGFAPIKLNCVVIKDFNDDEIIDFCNFAAENDMVVRFIEFMPIGNSPDWKKENIMTGKEILERIQEHFTIEALPQSPNAGPARNYKLSNGATVGIITPMSEHFCNTCDKIRLTSDGKIRPCLLSDKEISVSEAAVGRDKGTLINLIKESLGLKDDEHSIGLDSKDQFKRTMSKIGG